MLSVDLTTCVEDHSGGMFVESSLMLIGKKIDLGMLKMEPVASQYASERDLMGRREEGLHMIVETSSTYPEVAMMPGIEEMFPIKASDVRMKR